MFEQTFNNIDDILWKEGGCSNELDYVEQTSWVLFLKYLDNLEAEREEEAELKGETYERIIEKKFRWNTWAAPKTKNGEPDHAKALTGDDLTDFVNNKLFPYLKKFKETATTPQSLEYKIGEIFGELRNKITSGYNLREILWYADALSFQSSEDKHEMSHLYEDKIRRMGNAGRNGGEYYTPRPLIRTIVRIIDPKIGETVLDPACGSAGFLCEAYAYMKQKVKSVADRETLQKKTFYGQEKKGLAYIIGIMNMILHGVNAPNILHTNTLSENMANVEQKMRKDVIIANPPFGGKERAEVQQNFPIKTSETAYLFMQYFVKLLKAGGRAGIVIKNTFLSNTDNASVMLRKELLENCDLHTILDLPSGVFTGAGVKTVVLFFEKGRPTEKIWYYQPDFGRNLGKTNPLTEDDLAEFVKLQKKKTDSEKSWTINVKDLNPETYDLSVKNPNKKTEVELRNAKTIIKEMQKLNKENEKILETLSI